MNKKKQEYYIRTISFILAMIGVLASILVLEGIFSLRESISALLFLIGLMNLRNYMEVIE